MTTDKTELLGQIVEVRNPNIDDWVWRGRAIAIAREPSIIIEDKTGARHTLPLEWARPAEEIQ